MSENEICSRDELKCKKEKTTKQAKWALRPALNNWSKNEPSVGKKNEQQQNLLWEFEKANNYSNKYIDTSKSRCKLREKKRRA